MSHLEDLIVEYFDWKGYLVKRNVKVGRLAHGGWEMELDVIAFNPQTGHLMHLEPSIDADSWEKRQKRFRKKFAAGRKYIPTDIFTWLDDDVEIEQVAILVSHPTNRDELCGAALYSVDEFLAIVREAVIAQGRAARNAIPEQYPHLRTLQLAFSGYNRAINLSDVKSGRPLIPT